MKKKAFALACTGFAILFFALVVLFMFLGKITFGLGLGDLVYFYAICIWLVVLALAFRKLQRLKTELSLKTVLLFMVALLFSFYFAIISFTVGRGSINPWDGRILIDHHKLK